MIETINDFRAKAKDGQTFCASDEFFILAGEKVPDNSYYGTYDQYENGVGMMRSFEDDLDDALSCGAYKKSAVQATIVTGKLAEGFMAEQAEKINARTRCRLRVHAVENDFFGPSITVSGLVTGRDIAAQPQLKNKKLLIPANMLISGGIVFLDDTDTAFVEKNLNATCIVTPHDAQGLMDTLKEYGENS